jgi:hypothetical protein
MSGFSGSLVLAVRAGITANVSISRGIVNSLPTEGYHQTAQNSAGKLKKTPQKITCRLS